MKNRLLQAVRGRSLPIAVATASTLTIAAALVVNHSSSDTNSPAPVAKIKVVSSLESAPASSLSDWATFADFVVSASITSEESVPPAKSETADKDFTGRTVTVETKRVLWRRDGASHSEPASFTLPAWGWWPEDGGELQEVAPEKAPRLEVGREYVLALVWKPAECDEGDSTVPARWSLIGSDGAVPADGGVVGVGEIEGVVVDTRTKSAAGVSDVLGSDVAKQFRGKDAQALADAVAAAPRSEMPARPRTLDTAGCSQS